MNFSLPRPLHSACASLLLAFATATPLAQAQTMVDARSPATIAEIAKGFGSAELDTTDAGEPKITGRLNGRRYSVFFYGCKQGQNCGSIQLHWGIDQKNVPLSKVNEWNRTKRFGKAYIDNDGDLNLELDVNLRHGVTRQNLDDTFDFWRLALTSFYSEFVQ